MFDYKPTNSREKILVERERSRALQMETSLKKAVNIASNYKTAYENTKKELDELKKQVGKLEKSKPQVNSDKGIGLTISTLMDKDKKTLQNVLRKALHPDKNNGLANEVKNALGAILFFIEKEFEKYD